MPKRASGQQFPTRESKHCDFKESIDPTSTGDWCEIVKDIMAIAHSGGGEILVGLKNDGTPSGWDPAQLLAIDPAQVVDKIAKYTGEQFDGFEMQATEKDGQPICRIKVQAADDLVVFESEGAYEVGGKQKRAFAKGTIYFRHGAKSEPGNNRDLQKFVERQVERIRKSWLGNIRKVVEGPVGYQVELRPPTVAESEEPRGAAIRLVEDSDSPAYRKLDPDRTHPYRQKEVVEQVNAKLSKATVGSYDIQSVRKVHGVDNRPNFYYRPKFSSPQYSGAFGTWMVAEYKKDKEFFTRARRDHRGGQKK
jgi:hypothetical protein